MKPQDILVLALVAAAVFGALLKLRSNRKKGKSSCGCNCGSCSQKCNRRQA